MANFCTWCYNHGISILYSFKHKQNCKYFRCTCFKCEGTLTYLRNVTIQRVSQRKQAEEREKLAKKQRETEQQRTAKRKKNQNAMERKQVTGNEKSSSQKNSVQGLSMPSTSRDQSFKPYCKFCRNHGLSFYFIGQHYKSCKYRTCSCRKCQDLRGPAKSSSIKVADGSNKRSREEQSESPPGSSKRLCVENEDQPLANCPLCLNHGFSFPLKAHHNSFCLHKNCSCDPCRNERKSSKEKVTEAEEKEDNKSEGKESNKFEENDNNKSEETENNTHADKENINSKEEINYECEKEEKCINAVTSVNPVTTPPTDMKKPCAVVAPKPRLSTASSSPSSALEACHYQENNTEKLSEEGTNMSSLGTSDSTAAEENIGAEKTASVEAKTSEKNASEHIPDANSESSEVKEIQGVGNSSLHDEETTTGKDAPELIPDDKSDNAEVSEVQSSQETSNSSVFSETIGMPEVLDEEYHTVSEVSESSIDEGSNLSAEGEEVSTKVTEAMGQLSSEHIDAVMKESKIVSQFGKTQAAEESAQDSSSPNKSKDHEGDQADEATPSESHSIENSFGKVVEGSEEKSTSENGSQAIVSEPIKNLSNNSLESQRTPTPLAETDLPESRPEEAVERNSPSIEARNSYDGDGCNEETNAKEISAHVPMRSTHSAPRNTSKEESKSSKLFTEVSEINGSSNVAEGTDSPSLINLKNKDCGEKTGSQELLFNQETPMDASKNSTSTSSPEKKAPNDMADLMAKLVTLGKNLQSALPLPRSLSVPACLETSLFDESQAFDLSSHLQKSLSHSRYRPTQDLNYTPNTIQPGSELAQENGSKGMPSVSPPACVETHPQMQKETPEEDPESRRKSKENFQDNPDSDREPKGNSEEDPESCSKETDSSVTPPALHLVEDATLPQESTEAEEVTILPAESAPENLEVDLQKECDVCRKVFSASTNFRLHQYLKHDVDAKSNPGTMYHCRECPYENEKEVATLDHESSHMGQVPLDRMLKLFCAISNVLKN